VTDDRLLETFLDLIQVDSPSGAEAACATYCARILDSLGFAVRYDDSAPVTGSDTGNLIAELPGSAPVIFALSAHLDCVEPCRGVVPHIADGVVTSVGETVLGADDKAGLSVTLETMRRLVASGSPLPTLKVVFSVQEELGLVGAKHLDRNDAACDLCLVLDAEGPPGAIVTAAPTHYTFVAEFTGKASHAGVAPELGVSAIRMAADAIGRMQLGRLDDATTANVGSIHGGAATNVIPARCEVRGECRSLDRARVEAIKGEMNEALVDAARCAGGSVEIAWKREYVGFAFEDDDPLVQLVASACRDVGVEPSTYRTGGGSDANVLAGMGVPALALGCGMQGVHGTDEQIAVADLHTLAEICVAACLRLAQGR
jgi:tripeptide aminopeptidase